MRYKTILVGADGSDLGRRALATAARLAVAGRAWLVIVHGSSNDQEGRALLEQARADAEAAGAKRIETLLRQGPGAVVLAEAANQADANLIVVGSRGLTGAKRLLMGSVSHGIAHRAPCDVLIVRRGCTDDGPPYARLVIGTDGSATADRCARTGYELARALDASVALVYAGHPSTGELVLKDTHETLEAEHEAQSKLPKPLQADLRIEQEDPASAIIGVGEEHPDSLIVIGNKGLGGRFNLGSVPQKVMNHAAGDVLIARTDSTVLTDLAPGQAGIVKNEGRKIACYRDEHGDLHTLLAKCTHMGCTVEWNGGEKTWDCPCHGSRFAISGAVLEGPATRPLPPATL